MMGYVGTGTRHEWLVIFIIAAVVIFVSFILFTIAVNANEEKYDEETQDFDPSIDEIASAIEDVVTDGEDHLEKERPESISLESGNSSTMWP